MPSIDTADLHGLPAVRLNGPGGASALVAGHGAHVVSWTPAGGSERIWMSERSAFGDGAAIRGGVPVIFPQFSTYGGGRRHGFARLRAWTPRSRSVEDGEVRIVYALRDAPQTLAEWPHAFDLALTVTLRERELLLDLEVRNRGEAAFSFAAALHTYLAVEHIAGVRLLGLRGMPYRDQTRGGSPGCETAEALAVAGEIDRIYAAPGAALELREPARGLRIAADGFPEVVVWNPGAEKCAALADMPPRGFENMLCVEAALIGSPVALSPGGRWAGRQTLIDLA